MTFNLKTLKDEIKKRLDEEPDAEIDYSFAKWFEGFEKRQRSFLVPTNMGEWLQKNRDAKTVGELFTRFIKQEILGDGVEAKT